MTYEYESRYGKLTVRATSRTQATVSGEDLRINSVPYRVNQPMYLHPEGARVGSRDLAGWQTFGLDEHYGPVWLRRTDKSTADPTPAAREKILPELVAACESLPPEAFEEADRADVEADIKNRESAIEQAEKHIADLRREVELLLAGGREEYRTEGGGFRTRRPLIVMPNGDTHRTWKASYDIR